MNKVLKSSLPLLSIFALAACAGGGDNDQVLPRGEYKIGTEVNESVKTGSVNATSGKVLALRDDNDYLTAQTYALKDGTSKTFNAPAETVSLENTAYGSYQYMTFGAARSARYDDTDYFFYNGKATQDMPVTGSATYQGQVAFKEEIEGLYVPDRTSGTSTFNVDFGAKTVSGQLNVPSLQPIEVKANITNENFSGTARSAQLGTAQLEGKFFGAQAAELGGVFSDGNRFGGSFGAKKSQ